MKNALCRGFCRQRAFFGGKSRPASEGRELLQLKGLAVGALVHGGVELMGPDGDAVQGAVVLVGAVVFALLNGAFDAMVGMAVHSDSLRLVFC